MNPAWLFTGVQPEREVVQQWIRLAGHDLREAERALTETDDPAYEIACFHAQQAAEKYLKAFLSSRGISFPNTHDLAKLGMSVPLGCELNLSIEDLGRLTPYAVSSRYPGVEISETREDAELAIGAAKRVRDAILPAVWE